MEVDPSICLRCGACASVCPLNVIEVGDAHISVDEGCTDCGVCMKICPVGAIILERKKV